MASKRQQTLATYVARSGDVGQRDFRLFRTRYHKTRKTIDDLGRWLDDCLWPEDERDAFMAHVEMWVAYVSIRQNSATAHYRATPHGIEPVERPDAPPATWPRSPPPPAAADPCSPGQVDAVFGAETDDDADADADADADKEDEPSSALRWTRWSRSGSPPPRPRPRPRAAPAAAPSSSAPVPIVVNATAPATAPAAARARAAARPRALRPASRSSGGSRRPCSATCSPRRA